MGAARSYWSKALPTLEILQIFHGSLDVSVLRHIQMSVDPILHQSVLWQYCQAAQRSLKSRNLDLMLLR